MRASEELHQHNETARQLHVEVEARRQQLRSLVGEDTYDKVIEAGSPLVAALGGPVEAAYDAVIEAEAAESTHLLSPPNTVRNYRVLSLDGSKTLLEFSDESSMANTRAHKEVAVAMQTPRFRLEELLPDGRWVAFYPEHEGR